MPQFFSSSVRCRSHCVIRSMLSVREQIAWRRAKSMFFEGCGEVKLLGTSVARQTEIQSMQHAPKQNIDKLYCVAIVFGCHSNGSGKRFPLLFSAIAVRRASTVFAERRFVWIRMSRSLIDHCPTLRKGDSLLSIPELQLHPSSFGLSSLPSTEKRVLSCHAPFGEQSNSHRLENPHHLPGMVHGF